MVDTLSIGISQYSSQINSNSLSDRGLSGVRRRPPPPPPASAFDRNNDSNRSSFGNGFNQLSKGGQFLSSLSDLRNLVPQQFNFFDENDQIALIEEQLDFLIDQALETLSPVERDRFDALERQFDQLEQRGINSPQAERQLQRLDQALFDFVDLAVSRLEQEQQDELLALVDQLEELIEEDERGIDDKQFSTLQAFFEEIDDIIFDSLRTEEQAEAERLYSLLEDPARSLSLEEEDDIERQLDNFFSRGELRLGAGDQIQVEIISVKIDITFSATSLNNDQKTEFQRILTDLENLLDDLTDNEFNSPLNQLLNSGGSGQVRNSSQRGLLI